MDYTSKSVSWTEREHLHSLNSLQQMWNYDYHIAEES